MKLENVLVRCHFMIDEMVLTRCEAEILRIQEDMRCGPLSELYSDANSPSGWGARQLDRFGGFINYIWIMRPDDKKKYFG